MTWLVLLRPVREEMPFAPTADEERIVSAHFEYLCRLRDEGKLLLAGPSPVAGDTIGISILTVDEESEARQLLESDPAIVGGIMRADLRPFRVSVLRPSPEGR
jgi:uncharacterized protein